MKISGVIPPPPNTFLPFLVANILVVSFFTESALITPYNPNLIKLYIKGTVANFAYHFYLQNLSQLTSYKTPGGFAANFIFTSQNWNEFVAMAAKDSIELNTLKEKDKNDLVSRIKSSVARQLWRNEGFYQMTNKEDTAVKKAVELLSK